MYTYLREQQWTELLSRGVVWLGERSENNYDLRVYVFVVPYPTFL